MVYCTPLNALCCDLICICGCYADKAAEKVHVQTPAASQAVSPVVEPQTVTISEVTEPSSGFRDSVDALELDDEDMPEIQHKYGATEVYYPFACTRDGLSAGHELDLAVVGSTDTDNRSQAPSEDTVPQGQISSGMKQFSPTISRPVSAEAQALAAANRLQDAEQQLLHVHADTGLSNKVQNDSSMPDSRANCIPVTGPHAAADAHNSALPQQHDSAESNQAVCTMSADSASQGPSALQSAVDHTLLPQTTADASAASTPYTDSLKLAQAARLLHDAQEAIVPDSCEQTPQPAEPLQVACFTCIVMHIFSTTSATRTSLCIKAVLRNFKTAQFSSHSQPACCNSMSCLLVWLRCILCRVCIPCTTLCNMQLPHCCRPWLTISAWSSFSHAGSPLPEGKPDRDT